MKNKVKGLISFFVLIISAYMMITTKHLDSFGDYILEAIGLKAWSNHNSGWHLTVIYFGVLFLIALYCVRKYVIGLMQVRRRNVALIFFLSVTFLWFLTGLVVENVKGNSEGLLAIGYDSKSSNIEYTIENGRYIKFNAQITFANYSEANKEFYIHIEDPSDRDENAKEIQIYELDGEPALFKLGGKQTETFSITQEDYTLKSAGKFENGGGSGTVRKIVLEDIQGNRIRLDRENFIGIELGR